MYRRIPPVFSLEYLRVFLKVIDEEGYNSGAIRTAIFNERQKFEKEKFKAIGRGYRLKKIKSEHLVKNCYQLSTQIHLLERTGQDVRLAKEAQTLINLGTAHPETRSILLSKFLTAYIPFNEVLFCIRNHPDCEVLLPMRKEIGLFNKYSVKYGLQINQIQFEVVRDLLTQLEVLNWREGKDGERMQAVYLTAMVFRLSEIRDYVPAGSQDNDIRTHGIERCVHDITREGELCLEDMSSTDIVKRAQNEGYSAVTVQEGNKILFIKPVSISSANFESVLWEEYMKISDYKSNYPVYYSELRDDVCALLRISDRTFDNFIKRMINKPDEYAVKLHAGGGPMPPRRGLSSMLKVLPPKTGSDEYITFIKASR
jgi:hypothetical protein